MASKSDIRAGRGFVELFVKGAQLERGLNAGAAKIRAFSQSVVQVGRQLAAIGIGGGAGIAASLKRFADFDDQMRAAGAAIEATDAELKSLTETAQKLSASTGTTAGDVASLMTELGRAGFVANQVEKMTGAVLHLARATGTDATLASGIMSATIRQFGLDASDAARVADDLTTAANKSFSSVSGLGESLQYAGPVAKMFNLSLEETLAILGGLGNVGIQGSEAGTALRRLLVISGADAKKLQDTFGGVFVDAAGNARPLIDTLSEINEVTKDLGSAERAAKLNEAFGLLGITSAAAIGNSVGDIRELKTALDGAAGSAAATSEKMNAGLGGSLRKLFTAVESVALKIGDALTPAIQTIAARAIEISGVIGAWIDNNRELAVTLSSLVIGAGLLGAGLIALGTAAAICGAAIGGLSTLLGAVSAAAAFLATPVGVAVLAFGALDLAIVGVGAALIHASGIVPQLVSALSPLVGAVKAIVSALADGEFKKAWQIGVESAKYFGSVVLDTLDQLPEFAGYAAGRIASGIVTAFEKAWKWVLSSQEKLFDGMLKAAKNFGPSFLQAIVTGDITGAASQLAMSMRDVMKDLDDFAKGFESGLVGVKAPELKESERTKSLRQTLASMMIKNGSTRADSTPTFGTNESYGGTMDDPFNERIAATGGSGASLGESFDEQEEPDYPTSKLDAYQKGLEKLSDTLMEAGPEGVKAFNKGLHELRDSLGLISPLERYKVEMEEIQELFDGGIIDQKQFQQMQFDALPENVQAIIERAKTPLERFNEEISAARDALNAGLITPDQFEAEQTRLQGEFRKESKKEEEPRSSGRAFTSFSAAALMAQGIGGQGSSNGLTGKMDSQISELKEAKRELREIRKGIERAIRPFYE